MPRAVAGVLVQCDASIKAIILQIDDQHNHAFIIEEIDDEHLLIKSGQQDRLKGLLKETLKNTIKEAEEGASSESEFGG